MINYKRIELTLCVLMAALFAYAAGVSIEQQHLADGLLRLHVIANSDSIQDQNLKLKVRDEVLKLVQPLTAHARGQQEVRQILYAHLQEITDCANAVLEHNQAPYCLSAQIAEEYYPTRNYDTFSLPAGDYVGLKLRLGQASGRNWWCVVFPPLCTNAAQMPDSSLCKETTFRFKMAELIGEVRDFLMQ